LGLPFSVLETGNEHYGPAHSAKASAFADDLVRAVQCELRDKDL